MGLDNPLHIAFLVVLLLLVFGARRLPEIGRSLGGGMREFKDAITGDGKQHALTQTPAQQQTPQQQPMAQQQAMAQPAPAPVQAPPAPAPPTPAPAEPRGE